MNNLYENLHNLYPVQKTLRFELIPIGKTKENIERNGILDEDGYLAETFEKVRKYCDEYHKRFIEKSLKNLKLKNLDKYYELYIIPNKDSSQKDEFKKVQELLRKEISHAFLMNKVEYDNLFKDKMIKSYVKSIYSGNEEVINEIKKFDEFTTYFYGYNRSRKKIYSSDEKSESIAYRIINENLPTFIYNMKAYEKFHEKMSDVEDEIYNNFKQYIQTNSLKEMFELYYFNNAITQRKIEVYNLVISGKHEGNGHKIKGLNEYINEYNKTNSEKLPRFYELYKQILSDKFSTSDIIDNDDELVNSINEYYKKILENILNSSPNVQEIYEEIHKNDTNSIFVNNDSSITNISKEIFGDWNYILNSLYKNYDEIYGEKAEIEAEDYFEKRKKDLKKNKVYSIAFLEKCIENLDESNKGKITQYFEQYIGVNNIFDNIEKAYDNCRTILTSNYSSNSKKLIKDKNAINNIKELLDSIKVLQEFVKILIPKDKSIEVNQKFYSLLYEKDEILIGFIGLYNKVKNYLTQKPYSTEKIKLNFSCPTFLNSWNVDKEKDSLGVLLLKDNKYYLGILKNKEIFDEEYSTQNNQNIYKKVMYKQITGICNDVPNTLEYKDIISKKQEEMRKEGLHKRENKNFNIDFCRELIDVYKKVINSHKEWKTFDFKFSDTEKYNDINEFFKEVGEQAYKISFINFPDEYIEEKIRNDELYLFQIYNKDFSKFSTGKENLHTMYWKALFNEENIKDVVYKLNGNAEVFYRKASLNVNDTTVHPAGVPINNKNEETIKVRKTSTFNYDLIKNKRYTIDKFKFHVPITINFKSASIKNINSVVNKYLKENEDIYVMGIDRGERNLIYISVINKEGKIVYQKSLNEIVNKYNGVEYKTNYNRLLENKEKEEDLAQKSWKTVDNIQNLKEGYMSRVIHEIVNLMQKYNSIVVIEDLNKGFKNSRVKVDRKVYKKFEKMLIDKLNYLVIKDKNIHEDGGLLNAYQLTNKFDSFRKIGKQSGVLYHIPAWSTSNIDPTTGFVNLFNIKYENVEKAKEFISKFDDIRYNESLNHFEFDINYEKFQDELNGSKKLWTICTNSTRIRIFRNINKNNEWDTENICLVGEYFTLLKKYNIDFSNIKEDIIEKADSKFFNATKEKDGFFGFYSLFKLTVQMRNSIVDRDEDYIISPVMNKYGYFYDSRNANEYLPKDADANGAYNIARKGLMLISQIKNTSEDNLNNIKYNITNEKWLKYAQNEDNL